MGVWSLASRPFLHMHFVPDAPKKREKWDGQDAGGDRLDTAATTPWSWEWGKQGPQV